MGPSPAPTLPATSASEAVRDDSVTTPGNRCASCGRPFPAHGRQRFCSHACRQRAYRQRQQPPPPTTTAAAAASLHTVYECPGCQTRLLDEQRCPDCNLFCQRLGPGALCPHCDEPVALNDLLTYPPPDSPGTTTPTHPRTKPEEVNADTHPTSPTRG